MSPQIGGAALSELILDRAIARRMEQAEIVLAQADLDAERQRLLASLDDNADTATRLLNQMRLDRGLDDSRFSALLKRNAGLRRLVQGDIVISDKAIAQAFEVRYGARYAARIITHSNRATLAGVREKIQQRPDAQEQQFIEQAISTSTDQSAARGGKLEPIAAADDTYPKIIRDTLIDLSRQQQHLSPILAMPDGYALLWLIDTAQPDRPGLETVRDEIAGALRSEYERAAMQRLARSMIEQADVIVTDPSLDQGWREQRRLILRP